MTEVITIVAGILGIIATFLGSTPWGAKVLNNIKQRRAYARITGFDGIKVGARIVFNSPDAGGGSAPLADHEGNTQWVIASMDPKRFILRSVTRQGAKGEAVVQLLPTEFEAGTAIVI